MMRKWTDSVVAVSLVASLAWGCSPGGPPEEILAEIPLDSPEEVITKSGVTLDPDISTDGRGSIRVEASEPMTVRIAELEDCSVDDARLI